VKDYKEDNFLKFRKFGKLNWEVSALGFGTMRLPIKDDKIFGPNIDEDNAIKMIRYAIDKGVNYIDTAWSYHGGNAEILVRKTLQDGYRGKVKLATKLPSWLIKSVEDMDMFLDKQLEKIQTDYIDFYALHALNKKYWENYKKLSIFEWTKKVLNQGKIKHIGFSFHDDYNTFKDIIDAYDWDFCQIQYNYLDIDYQAGRRGLKYAAEKGIAVVIMEPLRGGSLAGNMPEQIQDIFNEAKTKRSTVDWALQWLWNQPEISVVLSGMSTMQQVKENIKSADKAAINSLSNEELQLIRKAADCYKELSPIPCTGCGYCIPCPNGVDIVNSFKIYNEAHLHNVFKKKVIEYFTWGKEARAANCVSCGKCENVCPQKLKISKLLKDVVEYFESA
jgi:hypothetical protein